MSKGRPSWYVPPPIDIDCQQVGIPDAPSIFGKRDIAKNIAPILIPYRCGIAGRLLSPMYRNSPAGSRYRNSFPSDSVAQLVSHFGWTDASNFKLARLQFRCVPVRKFGRPAPDRAAQR